MARRLIGRVDGRDWYRVVLKDKTWRRMVGGELISREIEFWYVASFEGRGRYGGWYVAIATPCPGKFEPWEVKPKHRGV